MKGRIVTLLNRDKTEIQYPITKDDAIYNENNEPLSDELKRYRNPDTKPTKGSQRVVTSDGIKRALDEKSAFHRPIEGLGTSTGATLTTSTGNKIEITTLSIAEIASRLIDK